MKSKNVSCPYCESLNVIRNGFYDIKLGHNVIRFKCKSCFKSFRSVKNYSKQEKRGRPRGSVFSNNCDSYSAILEELISFYAYKLKLSFYKSGQVVTGKSRPTIRRYLTKGNKNLNQDFMVKVFVKVKSDLEMINDGRLSLSMYKRLQNIANRIVKVTLGPPLSYTRGNTVIWNKKSPQYKELLEKWSQY